MLRRIISQPLGLSLMQIWAKWFGSTRFKEKAGVLHRSHYAYGMFRAADIAKYFGRKEVTVCEFGVATGAGLLNMIELAELITDETGIRFRLAGFDTGEGLPEIDGYKDHPELWSAGDFPMFNKEELLKRIGNKAELYLGDIKDTIGSFRSSLTSEAPLGFIAIDVDIYTATKHALQVFEGDPMKYLPAVGIYLDDIAFYFANEWCGELAAVHEFNEEYAMRKIDRDRSLPVRRIWDSAVYNQMYICHVLDHPARTRQQRDKGLTLEEHSQNMSGQFI